MKHLDNFDNYRIDEQSSQETEVLDKGGFNSMKSKFPKMIKDIDSSSSDTGPAPYYSLKIFKDGVNTMIKKYNLDPKLTNEAAIKLIIGFAGCANQPEAKKEFVGIGNKLMGFFEDNLLLYNKIMTKALGSSSNLPKFDAFKKACRDLCTKNGIK